MKQLVREIEENVKLYRDDKTNLAWIEDGKTGSIVSVHANISASGSVRGMKNCGYWGKTDRTVNKGGFIYNIDRFVYDKNNKYEQIVEKECMCVACVERRSKK